MQIIMVLVLLKKFQLKCNKTLYIIFKRLDWTLHDQSSISMQSKLDDLLIYSKLSAKKQRR